ncbi:MAG: S8 family serine peptidase [Anaerolineae bacterium]|nr:S8 family serine peptidase [Anaerolineae bacterium]
MIKCRWLLPALLFLVLPLLPASARPADPSPGAAPFFTVEVFEQPMRLLPQQQRLYPAPSPTWPSRAISSAPSPALECSILLVDDDWDQYEGEPFNGSGAYYYTSTLESLGYPYTRWDVWTQGDPGLADLQPYDAVIWFTGYAWFDTITGTNAVDLADYLDGGGNLLFSSVDYYYDQCYPYGCPPFAVHYLGIDGAVEDMAETDPVGNPGDPVGDGLGPYTLVTPSSWPAEDPTMWTDWITPISSAAAPFRYQASGEDNSTRVYSDTFKTVYLAWPFEGLDILDDRGEVLGGILGWFCDSPSEPRVRLSPPHLEGCGDPGAVVPYTLTLRNELGVTDTIALQYSSTWGIDGPAAIGPLGDGLSATFRVTVTIPVDAVCVDEAVALLTAWDSTAVYSDTTDVRTIVGSDWQNEENGGALAAYWGASTCTDAVGDAGACFYIGGIDATTGPTGRGQMFDIASSTWISLARNAPTPVFGATLGYIDGKLYLAGGFTRTVMGWGGTYELQIYDLAAGTWSYGPPIEAQDVITGAGGSAGGVVDGRLYVTGGCGASTCASTQHWAFDPAAGEWTALAPLPTARDFHAAVTGGGRLFVGGDYWGDRDDFWEYDLLGDRWLAHSDLPGDTGRMAPLAAALPAGDLFWWGGDVGGFGGARSSTWHWDPIVDHWTELPFQLNRATLGAGGGMADGRLWNFGGTVLGGAPLSPPPHESMVPCPPPTPPFGWLYGHVYDANTVLPVEGAYLYLESVTEPDYHVRWHTAADGLYNPHPLIGGDYVLQADGYGYTATASIAVTVAEGVTTTRDIYLNASRPELAPTAVVVSMTPGLTATVCLTLANSGSSDLTFRVAEAADAPLPAPGRAFLPSQRIDPQVYTDLRSSPDGSASFIIYLAERADLSAAFGVSDWSARGRYVLDALRATAERSQAALRAALTRSDVRYETHYIANAIRVDGDASVLKQVAAHPGVAFIGPNGSVPAPQLSGSPAPGVGPAAVEWNVKRVNADDVWAVFGARGAGIVVATIDSGALYTHEALTTQYRGNLGGGSFDHNYNWWDPYGQGPLAPYDWSGHGSHTLGVIVGNDGVDNQIGVAPEASWFACQGFDPATGAGSEDALLTCAEFILAPWDLDGLNPNPDRRAHVVNNSWGGGQAQWWYDQAVYAWRAAGILPFFSAGNDGPFCSTVEDPGDMANAVAIGALDRGNTNRLGSLAAFSGRGPSAVSGLSKPDVSAPGVEIRSAFNDGGYLVSGGTSSASPHVAGQAALIWSAQPGLIGDVAHTIRIIEQSAVPLAVDQGYLCGSDPTTDTIPNNQYGWGRIDAYAAVSAALGTAWGVPWLAVAPGDGLVVPGTAIAVELAFDAAVVAGGACYTTNLQLDYNDPYVVRAVLPVRMCVSQRLYLPVVLSAP